MGKKGKDIFEVFFRNKPALILIALQNNGKSLYGSILAKEANCTYSHAVKLLQEMESAKLIRSEKQGRIKTIKLTEHGLAIVEHLQNIQNTFNAASGKNNSLRMKLKGIN